MPSLTVSGNEITDASRKAASAWLTTQQGGMVDSLVTPGGFGVWRAATNLFCFGQCDGGTNQGPNGYLSITGEALTWTLDTTTPAPFSPQSVKVTTPGLQAQEGVWATSKSGQALVAGTSCVGAIWFKGVAGQSYYCQTICRNTDATNSSGAASAVFTATGAWQLLTPPAATITTGKTGDFVGVTVRISGTRAESFWVAHAMLESGQSVVAPYVATSGGVTATNNASRVQAPATLLVAAQGWLAARVQMGFASASATVNADVFDWRTDANNRIHLRHNPTTGKWEAVATVGGVETVAQIAANFNAGDLRTVIMAWGAFGVAISLNGSGFTTIAASLPTPSGSTFDIGSAAGANQINSSVLWAACGTGALSGADLAALSVAGNAPPSQLDLSAAAVLTAVMPMGTTAYWIPGVADVTPNQHTDDPEMAYVKARTLGYSADEAARLRSAFGASIDEW